ncbi:hypothetical protein BaRGS_00005075 [Batillaria attramentaria]|uniref:RRM domain-containing protein n=1 Tax=Batillaria attramentaria TaxID=370345 RepID=A0ABD0LWQ0_9CAEN
MGGREEAGKIFVGGLSWNTDQDSLQSYFSQFGEITDCIVMKNPQTGKSRGFGFVTFKDPSTVEVILASKTHSIDGRTVDAKACNARGSNPRVCSFTSTCTCLPNNADEDVIRNSFAQFGNVTEVVIMYDHEKGRSRGFGFLTFDNEDSVEQACSEHYVDVNGKQDGWGGQQGGWNQGWGNQGWGNQGYGQQGWGQGGYSNGWGPQGEGMVGMAPGAFGGGMGPMGPGSNANMNSEAPARAVVGSGDGVGSKAEGQARAHKEWDMAATVDTVNRGKVREANREWDMAGYGGAQGGQADGQQGGSYGYGYGDGQYGGQGGQQGGYGGQQGGYGAQQGAYGGGAQPAGYGGAQPNGQSGTPSAGAGAGAPAGAGMGGGYQNRQAPGNTGGAGRGGGSQNFHPYSR